MTDLNPYVLAMFCNRLELLADRLRAKLQPGHADYVSKAGAANIIERLVSDARKEIDETLEMEREPEESIDGRPDQEGGR